MEPSSSSLHLEDLPVTGGYASKVSNNEPLSSISPSKPRIAPDNLNYAKSVTSAETLARNIHIPYILNGELFEIQTQDGENVTVKCCNCPPDRVYRGSVRSTGNFHMHIKRRHPDLMGKIYDMKVNALVERRDRFLRNRKSTRRRSSNVIRNKGSISRSGQRMVCSAQPSSELFKIKAAFQRHQLQQQQQKQIQKKDQNQKSRKTEQNPEIMHKWNIIDQFLATPVLERAHNITLMDAYNELPLNYSLKQYVNVDTVVNMNYAERTQNEANEANTAPNSYAEEMPATMVATEQVTEYELRSSQNNNNTQTINYISTKQRSLSELAPLALTQHDKHVAVYSNKSDQSLFGHTTTLSAITPSPSDVSSYDGANGRSYDYNFNSLGIIKNELLAEIQPIDLSVHQSSSGFSTSSGFGSTLDGKQTSIHDTSTFSASGGNIKCDEVLLHIFNALQNLQRELQSHNQTNNHWLSLEIAKFKFLHPEFQFLY